MKQIVIFYHILKNSVVKYIYGRIYRVLHIIGWLRQTQVEYY